MPRLLMIAFDFPPTPNVGGALRSAAFARYLPEFGWEPTVLAYGEPGERIEGGARIVRVPSRTPWSRPYEVRAFGWAARVAPSAAKLLGEVPHHAMYISCPPFPQAEPLTRIAGEAGLPCVVDFRDAWSLDPYREGSRLKRFLYRTWVPGAERRLVRRTSRLILNTPSSLSAYQRRYPADAERMLWLPNGFDESDFGRSFAGHVRGPKMRLLYLGRFGVGGRNAELLLGAVGELVRAGAQVELEIVGSQPPQISRQIDRLNLDGTVRLVGPLPHAAALARLHACDVAVIYQERASAPVQAVAGKTFEYLRSGKPILAIGPAGDNHELVAQFPCRQELVSDHECTSVVEAIERLYRDWQHGALGVVDPPAALIGRFSRRELARILASVLDDLARRTA